MAFLYLVIGFFAALIAAVPPGAANILVVNTSAHKTFRQALYVIIGAGIGEVILSLIALHCTMNFSDYFKENPWIQITIFTLFLVVGLFFLVRNYLDFSFKQPSVKKWKTPKFLKGLLLAFLNPPVLIFWVLAFTVIHQYVLKVSEMSPFFTLLLFFAGVFLGKVVTLYFYGIWGKKLEEKNKGKGNKKNVFIGVALLLVGLIQGMRFFID